MFRSVFVAAAVAAGFPAIAAAQGTDALSVVERIMQLEVWAMVSTYPGEDQPFSDTSLGRYFTTEFAAEYRAVVARQEQRNEPLIDGDLIANSQEYCPLADIDIEPIGVGPNDGVIVVRFRSQWCWADVPADISERVDRVQFRLIRQGGSWKIDDFDSGGSVRALFAELMR